MEVLLIIIAIIFIANLVSVAFSKPYDEPLLNETKFSEEKIKEAEAKGKKIKIYFR